jgi:predicted Zn-dependent protease
MRGFRAGHGFAQTPSTQGNMRMPSARPSLNRSLMSLLFTALVAASAQAAPVSEPAPSAPVQHDDRAQSAVARLGEAATLFKRNDLAGADRVLTALIADFPGFADAHYLQGVIAGRRDNPGAAAASLRKAVELAPGMIPGWLALASIEHQRGGHKGMLAALRDGLKANPDNPDLKVELGAIEHEDGRDAKAVAILREILVEHPNHAKALVLLAIVLADKPGRAEEALSLIDRALVAAPNSPAVRVGEGWVLFHMGKAQDAATALEKAKTAMPKHGPLHFYLAAAYDALGRKDEARASVKSALELGLHGRELSGAKSLQKRLGS